MQPFIIAILILILCISIESWFSWQYLKQLPKYPTLWKHTGYRSWKTDFTLTGSWPTIVYLYRKKYMELGLKNEMTFCELHRNKVIISWAIGVVGVVLSVLFFVIY
jgi:hypothetical protein